jgi:hypothetical protein
MSAPKPECRHCISFDPLEESDGIGQCRYSAPARSEDGYGRWPVVNQTDWCGCYENKDGDNGLPY